MQRFERLQTAITLVLVALVGLSLLAFLDRQLIRADEADARRRREVAAVQVLNRLTGETERELQILRATAAFVAGSQQVTATELATYLGRSGVDRTVLRWLALVPRDGSVPLTFPAGVRPAGLPARPTPVGPPHTVTALGDSLRQVEVRDGSGQQFALIAQLDFTAIARQSSDGYWQEIYRIDASHRRHGPADGFALVANGRQTTLQASSGPDNWRVTVRNREPRALLTRGRQLLWGVGLAATVLALVAVYLRRQSWFTLQRRVRAATADLARQNQFLSELTAVIGRPENDPLQPTLLTRLLGDFMPVTAATLWLAGPDGSLTAGTDKANVTEPPPAAVIAAWQGQIGSGPGIVALPIDSDNANFGVLDVRLAAPLSSADRELLFLLTHHIGHALAGRRLSRQIDTGRRLAERILGSLSESVLVCSRDGLIHYANPAAAALFDLNGGHLQGHSAETLPLTPNPCVQSDPPVTDGIAWLLRQSQRAPVRYNRAPLTDDLVIVTLRDVSAEESASTQKAEFIALASHELRTPLAIIRAQTQALSLADRLGLSAERREHMQQSVIQQVDRLTKLVHDLLDASRLAGASVVPNWQDTDLSATIRHALPPLHAKVQQKGISLTTEIAADLPTQRTDPFLLEAIIGNLVDNAISYSPAGGSVRISARSTGDGVAIAVEDHGIGIAADDLKRLFQPFQRLQSPYFYRVRGTGLGLYLSREWAKTLGGTLSVSSQPGVGSTFTLHLPPSPRHDAGQSAA
jgi:signal transduction histidine kinase